MQKEQVREQKNDATSIDPLPWRPGSQQLAQDHETAAAHRHAGGDLAAARTGACPVRIAAAAA